MLGAALPIRGGIKGGVTGGDPLTPDVELLNGDGR